jgi:hypothetical protein
VGNDKTVQNVDATKQMKRANIRLAVIVGAVALAVYLFMIAKMVL